MPTHQSPLFTNPNQSTEDLVTDVTVAIREMRADAVCPSLTKALALLAQACDHMDRARVEMAAVPGIAAAADAVADACDKVGEAQNRALGMPADSTDPENNDEADMIDFARRVAAWADGQRSKAKGKRRCRAAAALGQTAG